MQACHTHLQRKDMLVLAFPALSKQFAYLGPRSKVEFEQVSRSRIVFDLFACLSGSGRGNVHDIEVRAWIYQLDYVQLF